MTSQPAAQLSSGDRVRHPKLGLGQVLDVGGGKAEIFFVDGVKKIDLGRVPLPPLVPRPAHPRLDRLDLRESTTALVPEYRNVAESIDYFLAKFPGGFSNEAYVAAERNHKEAARQQARELLSRSALDELLEEGNHSEACRRAKKNLLTNVVNWRASDDLWKQVLGDDARERAFASRLRTLLYGSRSEETAFEQFVSWLDSLGTARWPLSTYFRWIVFPDREVLVQPDAVTKAAAAWRYDVGYRSEVTWDGYRRIRGFFQVVRDELTEAGLEEVKPRDFIDVQYFMRVVGWRDG